MTYKALNTFIDDIFAFVIKMPTMYRLGCFRDDIVFFIFLYQRYIYKEDKSRVNEFGFSGDQWDESEKKNSVENSNTEEGTLAEQVSHSAWRSDLGRSGINNCNVRNSWLSLMHHQQQLQKTSLRVLRTLKALRTLELGRTSSRSLKSQRKMIELL